MRKICVITTTRAEYGLLFWLMKGLSADQEVGFQLVVTGTHLSADFGSTIDQIREDGFHIDRSFNLEMTDDSPIGISHSLSVALKGFSTAFSTLSPDIIVLLGDRFELLGAASAALIANIPVAHIHGGELTMGAIDDAVRHSITKMSMWHFVSTEVYRQRVIQLGEEPSRVFHVGGMGQDNIRKLDLMTKTEIQDNLGFKFARHNLLITYHPETLDPEAGLKHFEDLLFALNELTETFLIFTRPNADTGHHALNTLLENFVDQHPENSRLFSSLGQLRYLSVMKQVDAVVGNSSSGIIEAPSLKTATVNVGDRQLGRIAAESVIHVKADRNSLQKAFKILYSPSFQKKLPKIINPYGNGGASEKILKILKNINFTNKNQKKFHDN
jgi:GDP/UDP-N,N'-diacetylbacillosamine 2-epimerase (hydrolysing)